MNDKIRELQNQIEEEVRKIRNCHHNFSEAYYDPTTEKEPYGYKLLVHGSDAWPIPEGYRDVKRDRWTRKCKICGFEQHTTKTEPIITGHKPSF